MSASVHFNLTGSIAVITLDDGKANALSPAMMRELSAALDRAEKEARALVIAGRPGRFSAGFDLKVMGEGPKAALDMVVQGGELLLRVYELPMPVVMAVSGHAMAGGILLAATGDTRIGIRGDFKLGLNEVSNGMPVPILAHELARDRLLRSELLAATLHAKIYDPEAALAAGWLDALVDPEALAGAALAEAERLAALPRIAYGATKRSLRRQTIAYIRSTLDSNVAELTGNKPSS